MNDILERWGLRPVINASGTMTSLGASRVAPEIAADIADILGRFIEIDALQERASLAIAAATGADAGFITSSSSAAITLGVAAAITGDDLAAIEALPDCRGRQRRIAIQMGHMVNYGAPVPQAIALAGAEVVPLGTAALCETYHLEAELKAGLAAAVFIVSHHTVRDGALPLDLFIALCRDYGVPVIVDMASEYDLTGPVALGADVAIYSGHKFLAGPTSGIVAGTRKMVRAMYLQGRGIGRVMKVGKEGILGAIAALEAWQQQDHQAVQARELARVHRWIEQLAGLPGVTAATHQDWTGNPITRVELRLEPEAAGLYAWELTARLRQGDPAIALRDDLAEHQLLYLDPCNVTDAEADLVARSIRAACDAARMRGDGCVQSWSSEKSARGSATVPWLEDT